MRHEEITGTTVEATGAFTSNGKRNILGKLYAILYKPGTLDAGATITVTSEGIFSKPLLTKANAGTADALFYPRDILHKVEDGAVLTATAGGDRVQPLINGTIRFVVASGGGTPLTGSIVVYYED